MAGGHDVESHTPTEYKIQNATEITQVLPLLASCAPYECGVFYSSSVMSLSLVTITRASFVQSSCRSGHAAF